MCSQLPPPTAHWAAATLLVVNSPWGSSCRQDQINPFSDGEEGNTPASTCCQQLQGQSSLGFASLTRSWILLFTSCLWTCGLGRTQELYLYTVLLFLVGHRCVGISSLVGRQNNRDVPHLCNKHIFPSWTPTLWNPVTDQTSKNPSKQAELHQWRACQAHVIQVWWQAVKSQSTHLSRWTHGHKRQSVIYYRHSATANRVRADAMNCLHRVKTSVIRTTLNMPQTFI